MSSTDLILLHAPSVYDFRKKPAVYGPISDVVPSSQIFEMYPIGFMSLQGHLQKHGFSVRIINVALKMLASRRFNVDRLIRSLNPSAFGIDLHWLVHAQGSLELARIVKKYHPETPIIFGGLSASYYHEELIQYPQVDFVIRGDSAEEPLRQLLTSIKMNNPPKDLPNLTWKKNGEIRINDHSHVTTDIDGLIFDYRTMMSSSVKHRDLLGHLPFKGWLNYPIVAALCCRGCVNDCLLCGGSASAFRAICARSSTVFRSPVVLAEDIGRISRYFTAPIILLGDIRQAGSGYTRSLFSRLKELKVNNHIAFELFSPPPRDFLTMLSDAIPNFNIQISPESHDENIRKTFGKNYDNESLERTIKHALDLGCKRVDVFFMIGLPYQAVESVRETVSYCGDLMAKYGGGKVHPYISPLAPFLDPGSKAFEDPDKYGYKLIHRSLEDHRQALLAPSWKYTLNYETEWMSRHEIVSSTYEAAAELNRLKLKYGILKRREAKKIERRIEQERKMIDEIDSVFPAGGSGEPEKELRRRMRNYNFVGNSTICKKDEMMWPAKFFRFRVFRIIQGIIADRLRSINIR